MASMRSRSFWLMSGNFFLRASTDICLDCFAMRSIMVFICSRMCMVANSFSTSSFVAAGESEEDSCCAKAGASARHTRSSNPRIRFISHPPCRTSVLLSVIVQCLQAEEAGGVAQFFFDAKKLVVLRDAVGARSRTSFDLTCTSRDCEVGYEGIFGFT